MAQQQTTTKTRPLLNSSVRPKGECNPEKILQFGSGRFLRGFFDYFVHEANEKNVFNGSIVIVQSTGSSTVEQLQKQDGMYTLAVQGLDADGNGEEEFTVCTSISRGIAAASQWKDILEVAASPDLSLIVSNTTEVGIKYDPTDSNSAAEPPVSFPGKLTAVLLHRYKQLGNKGGITILPCELLENNGAVLLATVDKVAEAWGLDKDFRTFCKESCFWCNTLVDRIVTLPANVEKIEAVLGYKDEMLTACEKYRLFAIEHQDQAGLHERLGWLSNADENVLLTPDITPYRERKLRLLNGTHIAIAPMFFITGVDFVRQITTVDSLKSFTEKIMQDEIGGTLIKDGMDATIVSDYCKLTLERFRNPYLDHKLVDITFQACSKIGVRLGPIINKYIKYNKKPPPYLSFAFAAFLLFEHATIGDDGTITGTRRTAGREEYTIKDEKASVLVQLWKEHGENTSAFVEAVVQHKELWGGTPFTSEPSFAQRVAVMLTKLQKDGVSL